jgi:hypothetical protein
MWLFVTSNIERLISPFAQFWYRLMSDPLCPRDIFPRTLEVEDWYRTLKELEYIPRLRDHLRLRDDSVVTRLYICKNNSPSKHEYIVADVRRPDGLIVHVQIDRRGDLKPDDAERSSTVVNGREGRVNGGDREHPEPTPREAFRNSSIRSSYSLKTPTPAEDMVKCFKGHFDAEDVLRRYSFHAGQEPTLADLCIAATVAHRYDTYYSLLNHQCYWYADCIFAIFESLVDASYYNVVTNCKSSGKKSLASDYNGARNLPGDDFIIGPQDIQMMTNAQSNGNGSVSDTDLHDGQFSPSRQGWNFFPIATRKKSVINELNRAFRELKNEYKKEVSI